MSQNKRAAFSAVIAGFGKFTIEAEGVGFLEAVPDGDELGVAINGFNHLSFDWVPCRPDSSLDAARPHLVQGRQTT